MVIIIATIGYLLYAKHFAENFTYIISLDLESDNGKNRQLLLNYDCMLQLCM